MCENFAAKVEKDEILDLYLTFSNETTFHLCGIIKKQCAIVLGRAVRPNLRHDFLS
jgi:hypothetical protein